MTLIDWSDKLSVGVPSIDQDHQSIVALVNQLHGAMLRGEADRVLGDIIAELGRYTERHFALEERLFAELAYEHAVEHTAHHDELRGRVAELTERYGDAGVGIAKELSDFLRDWIREHIRVHDAKYAPYFRERGVR